MGNSNPYYCDKNKTFKIKWNNLEVVSQLSGLEVIQSKRDMPHFFLNPPKKKAPIVICDLEINGRPPN